MDEKKIFLAYIYRSLTLLYHHLYRVGAYLVFDNMYASHEDGECGCKDCMPTIESSLALHYKIVNLLESEYNVPVKLNKNLEQCILKLLNNTLPTVGEAITAGLIRYSVDKYNPIFSSLLKNK